MRILHVADLHQNHRWFDWVKQQSRLYDAVVVAGDLLNSYDRTPEKLEEQIRWTTAWLQDFPSPLFVCSGNHDYFPPDRGNEIHADGAWLLRCARPDLYVDGQTARIERLRWAVLSWTWREWPKNTDVVVVHSPPANTPTAQVSKKDKGDPTVYSGITEHAPRWVLSGHVHTPNGWWAKVGETWCFNPGCDFAAEVPNHIVIDTKTTTSVYHVVR